VPPRDGAVRHPLQCDPPVPKFPRFGGAPFDPQRATREGGQGSHESNGEILGNFG